MQIFVSLMMLCWINGFALAFIQSWTMRLEHLATYQLPLAGVWLQQLPWMVSFLRRFCNECAAWNLLCIAGCGHCSDLDWIHSYIFENYCSISGTAGLTRSHTSGLGEHLYNRTCKQTNMSHVLVNLFSSDGSIRFFVEACYKVAFKVRLGTPPAFVVLGVVAWQDAMQGTSMIHSPKVFFEFADVKC